MDINNKGQIVGSGSSDSSVQRAILWQNGTTIDLLPDVGSSFATGINDRGQVVGGTLAGAYVWGKGVVTNLSAIGNIPGQNATAGAAYDINNKGQVVGRSSTPAGQHATLWDHGQVVDLGTLTAGAVDSTALAINERSQVVGYSFEVGAQRAFIWQDGLMVNLNDLISPSAGFSLVYPDDINDRGQIIVEADNGHSYLLTPVPEPGTYALMLLGLMSVAIVVHRRKPRRPSR